MLTGYTSTLPTDVLLDSGALYVSTTVIGATQGQPTFDPGTEFRNVEYDGKVSDREGLDRIIKWKPVITASVLDFNVAQINRLEVGNTTSTITQGTVTAGTLYTPRSVGNLLTAVTHYVQDFRLIFERGDAGKYAAIYFPTALITKYDIKGNNKAEAPVSVTIEARNTLANADGICPYQIELRTALPA